MNVTTQLRRAAMALLLSAPACVLASASSSVVIDDIRFVLIDLDLSDQIDPSITFDNGPEGSMGSEVDVEININGQWIDRYRLKDTSGPFASQSTEVLIPEDNSRVFSSVERGDSDTGPHTMSMAGQVSYTPGRSRFRAQVGIRPDQVNGLTFSLSPKTLLLASARLNADLRLEVDDVTPADSFQSAGAYLHVQLSAPSGSSRKTQYVFVTSATDPSAARSFVDTLVVEMVNNTHSSTVGEFLLFGAAQGDSGPPLLVPEPSGLALALAGLFIAGGVLRRRSGMATRALAVTAAALGASAPALAAVSSSAALNNITLTLIDLAPDDGIDPWVTFTQSPEDSWTNAVNLRIQQYNEVIQFDKQHADFGLGTLFGNASAVAPGVDDWAQATITQGPSPHSGHSYSASGSLSTQRDSSGSYHAEAASDPNHGMFQLSPHTVLLVTAEVSLTALMTPHPHPTPPEGSYERPSASQASYHMSIGGDFSIADNFYAYQKWSSSWEIISKNPGPSSTFSELATVSFANTLDTAWTGQLQLAVRAEAHLVPAASGVVPEASHGAMALAGLAVAGFAVRRRRNVISDHQEAP